MKILCAIGLVLLSNFVFSILIFAPLASYFYPEACEWFVNSGMLSLLAFVICAMIFNNITPNEPHE